ncbi:hepatocyte growth factor receptor-like isoform X1 [Patiria miniata]|uniref:Protein kinase domain-containing protein n=2 Tax=Patiria miniata TaxID=46514 RepID=A0A914B0I0_PATMI|nr:hepatocyte growth factor receptor-like isoform X1 [Patiria miniata]
MCSRLQIQASTHPGCHWASYRRKYFPIWVISQIRQGIELAFKMDQATAGVLVCIIALQGLLFVAVVAVLLAKYYRVNLVLKSYYEIMLLIRIRAMHRVNKASNGQQLEPTGPTLGTSAANVQQPHPEPQTIVLDDGISIAADDVQIKFSQLQMEDELGQGAFGTVYRAVFNNWSAGERSIVAVKTVEDADPSRIVQFLKEGLLMKSFNHPNVLKLLGLTFDRSGQPLIVLPFMANGDLKFFLVKQKQNLSHTQLTMFAYHVALGMEYLEEQQFVHRDLAARNCLVDDKLVAKIADFGLSRDLDESDYYTSGEKQAKLPIKWMAPESMERKVYNTKTDVWSYGVLLWELFSRGRTPYPDIHNRDVHSYLRQGKRMNPPRFCPTKISAIMRHCWLDSAKKRWSFGQIVQELEPLVTHGNAQGIAPSCAKPVHGPCSLNVPGVPPQMVSGSAISGKDRSPSAACRGLQGASAGGSGRVDDRFSMEVLKSGVGKPDGGDYRREADCYQQSSSSV